MMRVVVPVAEGRISPVFDVATRLTVVDVQQGREVRRSERVLDQPGLTFRARHIADLGADVLICGAISRPLEEMLVSEGVTVLSQTCGPVEEVLQAFLAGELKEETFVMPGGSGHRRRFHGGRSLKK